MGAPPRSTLWLLVLGLLSPAQADEPAQAGPFPAKVPLVKPTDRPLSAAIQRLYDVWNPLEDRRNELYSNFKYSRLEGFSYEHNTSRRDPSKVLKIDGTYYVWHTHRQTKAVWVVKARDWVVPGRSQYEPSRKATV